MTNFDYDRQAKAVRQIRQRFDMIQADLARAIGVNRSQVSNWENPSKKQKMSDESRLSLAAFIGAQFSEVEGIRALLGKVDWTFTEREWREAEAHLDSSGEVPFVSTEGFVGREEELSELKRHILSHGDTRKAITVVEGMAGVGKSWLVAHLLRNESEIWLRFPDGLYWVSMEPPLSSIEATDLEQRAFRSLVGQVFSLGGLRGKKYRWDDPNSRRRVADSVTFVQTEAKSYLRR